jgi:DNA-binding NtrC family response regulator
MTRPALLVVDDETSVRTMIGELAAKAGFTVSEAATGQAAIDRVHNGRIDVALVDLCMPDIGGLEILRLLKQEAPRCRPIVMTGFGSIETAVEAMQHGALDFLQKPVNAPRLAKQLRGLRHELEIVRASAGARADASADYCGMVGGSTVMRDLFSLIDRLAPHARVVLVTGETGTGKELIAGALHQRGARSAKPFVPLNCSAVVETLVESELFGHVRGAFTGAFDHKPGLFEAADGGTLFLDEVGELPLTAQAKLLRVLESGEVRRVGSSEPRTVDVQVVAATNRDLEREIAASRFRADLYYRLNVIRIAVPPLRDRREDVPLLAARFAAACAARLRKPLDGVSPAAEHALTAYDWPGNVRELRNMIERACILAEGRVIAREHLFDELAARPAPTTVFRPAFERHDLEQALARADGNKQVAAQILGLSRRSFYRQLEQLQLDGTINRRSTGA